MEKTKTLLGTKLTTDGRGLWSKRATTIRVVSTKLTPYAEGKRGELRVYFDTNDWSNRRDGLIYTDPRFLAELRTALKGAGFTGVTAVDYSEQGVQGRDYVSLDAGPTFVRSWLDGESRAAEAEYHHVVHRSTGR